LKRILPRHEEIGRAEAPPEFGGRGLKQAHAGLRGLDQREAPPEFGGRGLKPDAPRLAAALPLEAPPEFGGRGLKLSPVACTRIASSRSAPRIRGARIETIPSPRRPRRRREAPPEFGGRGLKHHLAEAVVDERGSAPRIRGARIETRAIAAIAGAIVEAPPEFGGRGLKQFRRLAGRAVAGKRPPNSGGED